VGATEVNETQKWATSKKRLRTTGLDHHRHIYNPLDTRVLQGCVIARGPPRHCSHRSRRARSSENTSQYRIQSGSSLSKFFLHDMLRKGIINFNSHLLTCRLNSSKANYKLSTSKGKETKHIRNTKARRLI
jgi:hypothetical protein